MATEELRILFVEDSCQDTELEERVLRKGGLAFRSMRVETREALVQVLGDFQPNVVISDYTLPKLDGLSALQIVREADAEVPFIFVSGTLGEERAVASLKDGATDYFIKGRLQGLVHGVERALQQVRERAERRRLEAELRQSQKMETVGRLAGGVAHEFNNLLTVITGYTQLVRERLRPQDPSHADLGQVEKAGELAASLVQQLLAFSRKQVLQPRLLDLNVVVLDMVKMLRHIIKERIELEGHLNLKYGRVLLDRGQVEQVILNLALNARDAMPQGGKLAIETADIDLDRAHVEANPDATSGPHVMLGVSDTGCGMTDLVRSHLFEPFFTTKAPGKGTGLGLSTVYGIVRQSGGSISVASEPGKGTSFKIYFPRVDQPAESPCRSEPTPAAARGSETILVVDDTDPVRSLIRSVLVGEGYRVLEARDGKAAMALVESYGKRIHLLLTDLVMPGMSGQTLAADLKSRIPGLKVLYMSGYSQEAGATPGDSDSQTPFLPKPFATTHGLAEKVRSILDARR